MKKSMILLSLVLLFVLFGCGSNHEGQVKTPDGSSAQAGKNYKDVETIFEKAGFKNIKLEKIEDLITGWLTKDGEVEEVSVDGDTEYSPGEWVSPDSVVIIRYHTFKEDDATTEADATEVDTEDNSTMDEKSDELKDKKKKAKKKDEKSSSKKSNLLAYVNRGDNYYTYYIIDLANKTVRYGRNDSEECLVGEITSGDNLNDGISVTYKRGTEDEFTEILHWHYVDQDSALILVDPYGNETKYLKTDMSLVPDYLK